MEKLAPELYDEIIGFLNRGISENDTSTRDKVAQYLAISRKWKDSIEHRTFKEVCVRTDELEDFARVFIGANIVRRAVLKRLSIIFILLGPPGTDGCCDINIVPDREADSKAFSESVRKLFSILSDLEERLGEPCPITLIFEDAERNFQSSKGN
ncbi:hypothetical protein BU23DRAFT_556056 [Bimuria novae-zelandiae CBS 107.79]|uniref:Uncharacterized protein n=1 Tax=Bimuria novae-zelandiae CBS 107.79 TaxID=1447943 RepID=A0A6A5V5C3_9PLEO|nr:hypothetical protein BU23DRAFT_556056 [Bimuria novae-zelandiae CBS 107.79]